MQLGHGWNTEQKGDALARAFRACPTFWRMRSNPSEEQKSLVSVRVGSVFHPWRMNRSAYVPSFTHPPTKPSAPSPSEPPLHSAHRAHGASWTARELFRASPDRVPPRGARPASPHAAGPGSLRRRRGSTRDRTTRGSTSMDGARGARIAKGLRSRRRSIARKTAPRRNGRVVQKWCSFLRVSFGRSRQRWRSATCG